MHAWKNNKQFKNYGILKDFEFYWITGIKMYLKDNRERINYHKKN